MGGIVSSSSSMEADAADGEEETGAAGMGAEGMGRSRTRDRLEARLDPSRGLPRHALARTFVERKLAQQLIFEISHGRNVRRLPSGGRREPRTDGDRRAAFALQRSGNLRESIVSFYGPRERLSVHRRVCYLPYCPLAKACVTCQDIMGKWRRSPHLVWRCRPGNPESRLQNGCHCPHQSQPGHGQFSVFIVNKP